MKSFGLAAVFVLAHIIANVLSDCPEGGCKCSEFCVDSGNKWCNSDNDADCSCKKGCMIFDSLIKPDETKDIYCNTILCSKEGITSITTSENWCEPEGLEANVHYPSDWYSDPNCKDYPSTLDS